MKKTSAYGSAQEGFSEASRKARKPSDDEMGNLGSPCRAAERRTIPFGAREPDALLARYQRAERRRAATEGQATTEIVLLLPLLMFFLFAFAKVFAMLVLVQKMEVASYYAARRWQLESHRNVNFEGFDDGQLCPDIERKVKDYLGFYQTQAIGYVAPRERGGSVTGNVRDFLGIQEVRMCPVTRTQVWNVVTLTVWTNPVNIPLFKNRGFKFEVTKYVPNRDRPIAFVLPGLQP